MVLLSKVDKKLTLLSIIQSISKTYTLHHAAFHYGVCRCDNGLTMTCTLHHAVLQASSFQKLGSTDDMYIYAMEWMASSCELEK